MTKTEQRLELRIDASVERAIRRVNRFNKSVDGTHGKLKRFAGNLKMAGIGAAAAVVAIGKVAYELAKIGSDFEETQSKFQTVFSAVQADAVATAKTIAQSYGLSSKASMELLANTGDLLAGFGFTQEASLDLSSQVNRLAVDLASFTNYSGGAKGASEALTKALLGERESLKSLGIAILESDIKQLAEDKGITGTLSRQTKAMLTLELAVKQSKNAIGDFARTQDSLANQTRILKSRWDDLVTILGRDVAKQAKGLVSILIKGLDWVMQNGMGILKLIINLPTVVVKSLEWIANNITDFVYGWILTFQYWFDYVSVLVFGMVRVFSESFGMVSDIVTKSGEFIGSIFENVFANVQNAIVDFLRNIPFIGEEIGKSIGKRAVPEIKSLGETFNEVSESINQRQKNIGKSFMELDAITEQYHKNTQNNAAYTAEKNREIAQSLHDIMNSSNELIEVNDELANRQMANNAMLAEQRARLAELDKAGTESFWTAAEEMTKKYYDDLMAQQALAAEGFKNSVNEMLPVIEAFGNTFGNVLAETGNGFEALKEAGKEAIAVFLESLAKQAFAQAAIEFALLNIPMGIALTAAGAGAITAAGAVRAFESGGKITTTGEELIRVGDNTSRTETVQVTPSGGGNMQDDVPVKVVINLDKKVLFDIMTKGFKNREMLVDRGALL